MEQTSMAVVLGIDPGFASLGFCFIEVDGKEFEYREGGIIKTSKDKWFAERLHEIQGDFRHLIEQEPVPDIIAIEKLFFYKNTSSAIDVAQARGVIMCYLGAWYNTEHVFEYTPSEIKKQVTGDGKADKKAIRKAVERLLKVDIKEDNACDAAAIALTHIMKANIQ